MSRVSQGPARRRPSAEKRGRTAGGPGGWRSAAGWAGAIGLVILAAYLVHPLTGGHRLPVGPDGPVYAWWAGLAEAEGLDAIRRPGVPGLLLALGAALGTDPLETAAILGPLLAAVLGSAAAALAETSLGADRTRSATAALLTAAFGAALAPGWLANLAMAGLFAGAIALLARADRSPRAVVAATAMLAAAALAHWYFVLIGAAVLLGAAVILAVTARRAGGDPGPGPARMGAAALAGTTVGALGLVPVWTGHPVPGDTSQDQFFRRAGEEFRRFLRTRFRERLWADLGRYGLSLAASASLAAAVRGGRASRSREGSRYLGAVAAAWAAITVAGVVLLAITGAGPAGRLLAFAFFLPFAAALGMRRAVEGGLRRPLAWVALAGAVLLVGSSLWSWYRQGPYVREAELAVARTAARALAAAPDDTPLVFLVETDQQAAAFHVTRYGNVIRAALPPERIGDARLAVGAPDDLLAGRPTSSGDIEHDRLSEIYLEEARPLLGRAVILSLEPFAGDGFGQALAAGAEVGPGVVQLGGPALAPVAGGGGRPGLSGRALAMLTPAALLILAALGLGWARWGLAEGTPLAVLSLAPSAGLAVAVVGAYAADRLGLGAGAWGAAAAALLGTAGFVAAVGARERPVQPAEQR